MPVIERAIAALFRDCLVSEHCGRGCFRGRREGQAARQAISQFASGPLAEIERARNDLQTFDFMSRECGVRRGAAVLELKWAKIRPVGSSHHPSGTQYRVIMLAGYALGIVAPPG